MILTTPTSPHAPYARKQLSPHHATTHYSTHNAIQGTHFSSEAHRLTSTQCNITATEKKGRFAWHKTDLASGGWRRCGASGGEAWRVTVSEARRAREGRALWVGAVRVPAASSDPSLLSRRLPIMVRLGPSRAFIG
ncbi:hypothetical protein E2C01_036322 [Portunus trituberculatus]|uniref:Uncharacterized protein n=1 Tax=Portunus trituberculatus TaxID=210409 RepID=A0A5B7FB24_PORTR|nr:hypothetical protein [Portunus trituberculatus]